MQYPTKFKTETFLRGIKLHTENSTFTCNSPFYSSPTFTTWTTPIYRYTQTQVFSDIFAHCEASVWRKALGSARPARLWVLSRLRGSPSDSPHPPLPVRSPVLTGRRDSEGSVFNTKTTAKKYSKFCAAVEIKYNFLPVFRNFCNVGQEFREVGHCFWWTAFYKSREYVKVKCVINNGLLGLNCTLYVSTYLFI